MNNFNLKVYLASGWFNPKQAEREAKIKKALRSKGLEVFSPQENQLTHLTFGSVQWREEVFHNDINEIEEADIVFAIYDEMDAGTMMEIGYAYAIGTPILIFNESEEVVNLMISDSLHAYFTNIEEVLMYDFEQLPTVLFTGTVL